MRHKNKICESKIRLYVEISSETHEVKYTVSVISGQYFSHHHMITKKTGKSLCGKDASRWTKSDSMLVSCLRCQRVMERMTPVEK
jgi:hypothetical protein